MQPHPLWPGQLQTHLELQIPGPLQLFAVIKWACHIRATLYTLFSVCELMFDVLKKINSKKQNTFFPFWSTAVGDGGTKGHYYPGRGQCGSEATLKEVSRETGVGDGSE